MSYYTITIAPDDRKQATATVRVKITDSEVRIDEVVIRSGERGLTARALQSIDLDLLTRAVAPPTSAGRGPGTGRKAARKPAPDTTAPLSKARVVAPPSAVVDVAGPKRPTSRRATAAPAARQRTAPAPDVDKPTPVRTPRKAKKDEASTPPAEAGRTYRRAPADLASVWRQVQSVHGVADHYDVPQHTAASWVRTLKKATAND